MSLRKALYVLRRLTQASRPRFIVAWCGSELGDHVTFYGGFCVQKMCQASRMAWSRRISRAPAAGAGGTPDRPLHIIPDHIRGFNNRVPAPAAQSSGPGYSTNGVSGYSHSMTPAGMRETAAREEAAREAAARDAAARDAAARRNAAAAEREAITRDLEARAARRNAAAAPNKNKVKAPLNFWLRANGVKVMSAAVEDNKSYVLLVTNFETNSDDVFKVTKIGDRLYKVGKYSTGRNNEILYERMVQELVADEGAAELYKVPDSLQSGSGRKSRRNRRKSHRSRKSRKHH